MSEVNVRYDEECDVLYISVADTSKQYGYSQCWPDDDCLIVAKTASGEPIGVTVMDAKELPLSFWMNEHSASKLLPLALSAAISDWISAQEKSS
jgi:uncharacterized protein YuzE